MKINSFTIELVFYVCYCLLWLAEDFSVTLGYFEFGSSAAYVKKALKSALGLMSKLQEIWLRFCDFNQAS